MDRRLSLWIFVLALTLTIATGAPAQDARDAQDEDAFAVAYQTAEQQLQAGRLFPAEGAARDAVGLQPDSAAAHFLLGKILIGRTQFAEAETELSRAATIAPDLPGVDRELGLLRFERKDFEGARTSLERALRATPDESLLWMRLGLAELELGRLDAAESAFERAAQDPELAALADYNLAIVHDARGDIDNARTAYERALSRGLPTSIADRATTSLAAYPDRPRPWSVSAAAGVLYESAVSRPETQSIERDPDGAAQIEVGGDYQHPIAGINARIGYDFFQKLYFETTDFDLQSHTLSTRLEKKLGPVSTSLGYVYSLNLLGGTPSRFLDFHEVRASGGLSLTDHWYLSLSPGFRAKRFDDDGVAPTGDSRNANTVVAGLLNLFPLGDWSRYMILGLTYEHEDADPAFDYEGVEAQLAFHLPVSIASRELPIDLRYLFRFRNYTDPDSLAAERQPQIDRREDFGHFVRVRLGIPIAGTFRLLTEYEFENVDSELSTVDRSVHQAGLLLQLEY